MISTLEGVAWALDPEEEGGGGEEVEEMGARSWSAAGPSPTQTARTPACLQSSVYPSPPAMTVQQQQHFHQHQPLSSSPAAWHNRCSDRPTTKYRKWPARSVATVAVPSAAAATTTATDQQVSFSLSLSLCVCLVSLFFCP